MSAFEKLMKGSRAAGSSAQKRSGTTSASAATTSSSTSSASLEFQPCPMCGRSFSTKMLPTHMEMSCSALLDPPKKRNKEAEETQTHALPPAPKSPPAAPALAPAAASSSSSSSSFSSSSSSSFVASAVPPSAVPPVATTKQPRTGTVHDFFGGEDHSAPSVFYMEWPHRAVFLRSLPTTTLCHKLGRKLKWQGKELVLCANFSFSTREDGNGGGDARDVLGEEAVIPEALLACLKSHLQKCVRRRRKDLAMRSALHLLRMNASEFLRRLPIIVVEDAILVDKYPMFCWFMAAVSKGMCLAHEHVAWLLGAAEAVADLPRREHPRLVDKVEHFPVSRISKEISCPEHQSMLYALQLRRSFGGMQGDMRMLDGLTHDWLARFAAVEAGAPGADAYARDIALELTPIAPEAVLPLRAEEWDLSALDFHCTDIDMQLGAEAAAGVLAGLSVRELIWQYSSSTNTKALVPYSMPAPTNDPALAHVWEEVKGQFANIAWRILQAKYKR